jgi:hypothetical protein
LLSDLVRRSLPAHPGVRPEGCTRSLPAKAQPEPAEYGARRHKAPNSQSIMSNPCELIIVWCPCGTLYRDSRRPSMNFSMDDFDDDYIERMSSTTCPNCGLSTQMGTLLSRIEDDRLTLEFQAVPEPLPVIPLPGSAPNRSVRDTKMDQKVGRTKRPRWRCPTPGNFGSNARFSAAPLWSIRRVAGYPPRMEDEE